VCVIFPSLNVTSIMVQYLWQQTTLSCVIIFLSHFTLYYWREPVYNLTSALSVRVPNWHSQYSDQLQVGRPRVPIPMGTRFLSFSNHPDWLGDPPSSLFSGYHCSFLGVKQPGLDSPSHHRLVPSLRVIGAIFLLPYSVDRGNFTSYYLLPDSTYLLCEVLGILWCLLVLR